METKNKIQKIKATPARVRAFSAYQIQMGAAEKESVRQSVSEMNFSEDLVKSMHLEEGYFNNYVVRDLLSFMDVVGFEVASVGRLNAEGFKFEFVSLTDADSTQALLDGMAKPLSCTMNLIGFCEVESGGERGFYYKAQWGPHC